jgi:hypothetical protein
MKTSVTKPNIADSAPAELVTPEILEVCDSELSTIHKISDGDCQQIMRLPSPNEFDEMVAAVTENIFARRRTAYEKLAEGVQ